MGWGSDVAMGCGVGHRWGSDPTLMWCRPAASAPIQPLAWEPPGALGAALKRQKKKKERKKRNTEYGSSSWLITWQYKTHRWK